VNIPLFLSFASLFISLIALIIAILIYTNLNKIAQQSSQENRLIRDELTRELRSDRQENTQRTAAQQSVISETLAYNMQSIDQRIHNLSNSQETKLEAIRISMEKHLSTMQAENQKKLDEMRSMVDEKLQKTLEDRISQSFKLVSDRLEQVYKGLGEMQVLAAGVGDLKKVLSNVKTRGVLGEYQLSAILEQILASEQYAPNVCTKKGSRDLVEFAVKLPGNDQNTVWLPIDAKFPADAYTQLVDAYDGANPVTIQEAKRNLELRIKKFAKDIREKYIDPPYTTDFAIMFLPFEGLYAEVVRQGLIETLQQDYKVNIAGPTTMAALLNSLQMGFKTLAIQKRTSEVWQVLGAVKTEFDKFGSALTMTQQRLEQANQELDKLVGVRTRQIQRRLKSITCLPEEESTLILDCPEADEND
jgi:DNA recombination protein RmuC